MEWGSRPTRMASPRTQVVLVKDCRRMRSSRIRALSSLNLKFLSGIRHDRSGLADLFVHCVRELFCELEQLLFVLRAHTPGRSAARFALQYYRSTSTHQPRSRDDLAQLSIKHFSGRTYPKTTTAFPEKMRQDAPGRVFPFPLSDDLRVLHRFDDFMRTTAAFAPLRPITRYFSPLSL